jgi:hypothetical protein
MTTAVPSAALATIQPVFTDAERAAPTGFLAGYRGLTREAYALDLRQFASWCHTRPVALFAVRRADIESFARDLEAIGRARATVTGVCPPSPGSTSTRSWRSSWIARRLRTCGGRGSTTSRMRSRWTATSSARCWSLRGSAHRSSTR